MNLKSTGIVTLHAYLPPQHAVKAKSAPGGYECDKAPISFKAGAKLMPNCLLAKNEDEKLINFKIFNPRVQDSCRCHRRYAGGILHLLEMTPY